MRDDAHRAAQPGSRRRADRVLRRTQRTAFLDPGDLARRDGAHLRGAHGANSLRYASTKHWGPITKAMRDIYTSSTVEAAEARFEAFAGDWEGTYPAMIGSWRQAWDEFAPFLEFPPELRRVVCTTNAVESLNARFRRAVRHRGHSPNEQTATKTLYLVATAKPKNRTNLTAKTNGWTTILNTLTVHYGDRIADHIR